MASMISFHCSCGKNFMVYVPKVFGTTTRNMSLAEMQRTDEEEEKTGEVDSAIDAMTAIGFEVIDGRKTSVITCEGCGTTKDVKKDIVARTEPDNPTLH